MRLKSGVFYSVVTNAPFVNAPFVGRVEKGVETSVHVTEFAVIRILGRDESQSKFKEYKGDIRNCWEHVQFVSQEMFVPKHSWNTCLTRWEFKIEF